MNFKDIKLIGKYRWEYYPHENAGYLKLRNGKIDHQLPLKEGVILDLDKDGNIIGVEILD